MSSNEAKRSLMTCARISVLHCDKIKIKDAGDAVYIKYNLYKVSNYYILYCFLAAALLSADSFCRRML